jgi:hypothetical protein
MGASGLFASGLIRILAAAVDEKLEGLPDVPIFKDFGLNVVSNQWTSLCAPKGTPKEMVGFIKNWMDEQEPKISFDHIPDPKIKNIKSPPIKRDPVDRDCVKLSVGDKPVIVPKNDPLSTQESSTDANDCKEEKVDIIHLMRIKG